MIKRHLGQRLKTAATRYPVVTVTGPRQSGKTTLVRAVLDDYRYVSIEDPDTRAYALQDPRGFLARFESGVILDEVQRTPNLFSYIQGIVDAHDRPGQFILTGSQNFLLMEKITQSLAGRCAVLHLLPFSRSELLGWDIADLNEIEKPRRAHNASGQPDLFDMLRTGFYPRIHDKKLSPQDWLANYYQTYVERDVRQLLNIGDVETFGRFIRLCAGRCGQLLNMASLGADCGVSTTTVKRWLSILETSFVIYLLRPHHKNFNKRLVKSPKLYFLDTGLLCYLLGVRSSQDLRLHAARGCVFESWVLSEVLKNFFNCGEQPRVNFWRDSAGHEIDLLIDRTRDILPLEAKSGQTFSDDFTKPLRYWRSLTRQPQCPAAVVYGGDESYTREDFSVISWKDFC